MMNRLFLLVALPLICSAEMVPRTMSMSKMDSSSATQLQNQASGLAYIETMGLVTSPLGRGQASATTTRTCARPLALSHESQFVGRPTPSLSSLQRTSGLRASMSKATGLSMQADSFDPLGLASGMGSGGDVDTAIVQKQLWTAAKSGDLAGMEGAIQGGADANFNYPDEGDATALQCAALNGNTKAIEKLVALGADVSAKDKYGWTPLHDAALNGHNEAIAKLIELGADVNSRTQDVEDEAPGAGGRTAVTNAAMNGHTETVKKLVEMGADVNARQKDGWTALHLAAKNGWEDTVETLVKLGIDVNAKNDVDMTALHYAAWDATIETCKKLMELGVDVGHKAKGKLSALDLAERRSKETSGRMVAAVLREAMGIEEEVVQAPTGDWVSDPDSEWRKLIKNDAYAKSSDGLDF